MDHSRLRELPILPKGAVARPLSCSGPGKHDTVGYRCANHGLEGCLGFVCKRCALKQEAKPYLELCAVCLLAIENGGSMDKALAKIEELHPTVLKTGKIGCASTDSKARPCKQCVRHKCQHCEKPFRSHHNRTAYCGDLCKAAARRETHRRHYDQRRLQRFSAAA